MVEERVDVIHAGSRAPGLGWRSAPARIVERPAGDDLSPAPFLWRRLGAETALQFGQAARGDACDRPKIAFHRRDDSFKLYPYARDKLRVIHRGADLRAFSPGAVEPERVTAVRAAWGVATPQLSGNLCSLAARLDWLEGALRLLHRGGGGAKAAYSGRRCAIF